MIKLTDFTENQFEERLEKNLERLISIKKTPEFQAITQMLQNMQPPTPPVTKQSK